MRLAGKIALHLVLILAVMAAPPAIFDAISNHGGGDSGWAFAGGLAYPLYLGWWVSRIGHPRIRVILLHLLVFATLVAAALLALDSRRAAGFVLFAPAASLLPSLVLMLVRAGQRRGHDARTHLYALILLVPFTLLLTLLVVYAMGMSAMQGMRW